jgi:ketosteroid isomerase-like protein
MGGAWLRRWSRNVGGLVMVAAALVGLRAAAQSAPVNVAGKWSGAFEVRGPGNELHHETAFFTLMQAGAKLSGSAGPSEQQASPLSDGAVAGNEVRFSLRMGPDRSVQFALHAEGGHLRGQVTGALAAGGRTVVVDVTPVPVDTGSQYAPDPALYDAIAKQDAALFAAYNARDAAAIAPFFAKELEFYHDNGNVWGYEQNLAQFRENFARPEHVRREVVPGTLEIFPMGPERAFESGTHRFYTTAPGKPERLTATARFVEIWQRQDGSWKLLREISYDHR